MMNKQKKRYNIKYSHKSKKALEDAGATVYLTHTTDELVQLGDICDYSEEKGRCLYQFTRRLYGICE